MRMLSRALRAAVAVCVPALALAPWAHAAGAATKTLAGQGAVQGKLMTRDELRACVKEQRAQQARAAELEARRGEIAAEADAVRMQKAAVQAERDAFAAKLAGIQAFNERVTAHGERVAIYNQRSKEFNENPPRGADAQRQRGQLEAEGEALAQADAAIKAEAAEWAALEPVRATLAERVRAQQAAAAAAIEHHRAFNDDAKAHDDGLTAWQGRCGNRPYLVSDDKVVRAEMK